MSYVPITSAETESGKPVTQELFGKVRDDIADHESRILTLEGSLQQFQPMKWLLRGAFSLGVPLFGVEYLRLFSNVNLTGAVLLVPLAGSARLWDVDVQLKRGVGAFSSIFSTRPSVDFSAGDYSISTNAVLTTIALLSGDILRIDVQDGQTDSEECTLYLPFEAA